MPSRGDFRSTDVDAPAWAEPAALEQAAPGGRDQLAEARFLGEAGLRLAASLDYETTLQRVAQLAVPFLADWCYVAVQERDGAIRTAAVAHSDPVKVELARELLQRYPLRPDEPYGVAQVLRTGTPLLFPRLTDAHLIAAARDSDHLHTLREIGFTSTIMVPLNAHGRTHGVLALVWAESGRQHAAGDLALAAELAGHCALAVDNARRYRDAQEQAALAERVNAALQRMAAERDRALEELENAVQTRDEFLGTISHDLKNPLTAIKGIAQSLQRHLARATPADPERLDQGLATIDRTATHLSSLVDELMDLARLQTGSELRLQRVPTDLAALAERAAEQHRQSTDRHRIGVEAGVPALIGEWDATRLGRVLDNLLNNAIKYSPAGGDIAIRLWREEVGGAWAMLSVQDHGLGIPEQDIPHIFERFRRGGNVAGSIAGTGIGLAGARQIVEQHGGGIDLESAEGAGSTFTVRLPLGAAPGGA